MVEASISQQISQAFDDNELTIVAPAMKSQYVKLREAYNKNRPDGVPALQDPHDDPSFDAYIEDLAKKATEKTAQGEQLRKALRAIAPDEETKKKVDFLDDFGILKTSAADAGEKHHGPIFGATLGDLWGGLVDWVRDGGLGKLLGAFAAIFSGDFSKFGEVFNDFKHHVAKHGADGFLNDFGSGATTLGARPSSVKGALDMGKQMADQTIEEILDPSKKKPSAPLDLSKIKIMGVMADNGKPVDFKAGDKDAAMAAVKDHFTAVADNLIGSIPENLQTADIKAIVTQAKASFVAQGATAAESYIKEGKVPDNALKLDIMKRTITDMKTKLAADPKNAAMVGMMDGALQKFSNATSFDKALADLKADPKLANASLMMDALAAGVNSPKLAEIVAKANPGNADLQSQLAKYEKNAPAAGAGIITGAAIRKTIVDNIEAQVGTALDPATIKKTIDDNTGGVKGLFAPGDIDRQALANFMHDEMGKNIKKLETKILDSKTTSINLETTKTQILTDFNAAVDRESRDGGRLAGWQGNLVPGGFGQGTKAEMIKNTVKDQFTKLLSDPKANLNAMLNGGLKAAAQADAKIAAAKVGVPSGQYASADVPDGSTQSANVTGAKVSLASYTPPASPSAPATQQGGDNPQLRTTVDTVVGGMLDQAGGILSSDKLAQAKQGATRVAYDVISQNADLVNNKDYDGLSKKISAALIADKDTGTLIRSEAQSRFGPLATDDAIGSQIENFLKTTLAKPDLQVALQAGIASNSTTLAYNTTASKGDLGTITPVAYQSGVPQGTGASVG